jgi:hypothetical protein
MCILPASRDIYQLMNSGFRPKEHDPYLTQPPFHKNVVRCTTLERILLLSLWNLHEELSKIDQELAQLEERRSQIINRMSGLDTPKGGPSNVIHFPTCITVRDSPTESADDWPRRSKPKSSDLP